MSYCDAKQLSDMMHCEKCDLMWDVNDTHPPECGKHRDAHLMCEHGVLQYVICEKCMAKKIVQKEEQNKLEEFVEAFENESGKEWELDIFAKVDGYGSLARVLNLAYEQSALGKGKERHANDLPFDQQPIMQIARMVGIGGHSYQICKKAQEATTMSQRGKIEAAKQEFLGAIVYSAAAILLLEEMEK